MSVGMISFYSFVTGVGSCAAFQAALKTATLNWPTHRGSATAFPLAAFGLSAFFYTLIAGIAFPGNTSGLLTMLSFATSLVVLVAIPFLIVVDHKSDTPYAVLPTSERARRNSNLLHQARTKHSATVLPPQEISKCAPLSLDCSCSSIYTSPPIIYQPHPTDEDDPPRSSTETSSLLSEPGDVDVKDDAASRHSKKSPHSHCLDITGFALLTKLEFWQLWILMGLLTGVGIMTIKCVPPPPCPILFPSN
jgi:hypothetical protein